LEALEAWKHRLVLIQSGNTNPDLRHSVNLLSPLDSIPVGITKFQSRSLQAWQEAGAKHLFPTDPTNKKKEELPYMMRRGGSWDGADIKGKGVGQGKAFQRTKTDEEYEKKRKQGMLDSVSIFGGQSLPWSNDATRAMARPQQSEVEKKMMKKGQAKKAAEPAKDGNAKKFFGLF